MTDITFDNILEKTKLLLGENYKEKESENPAEINLIDLQAICTMVIREASQWTNRYKKEQLQDVMNECWPVIVKCSCVAYLNRGAEGLGSQSELGQQNVYVDWIELMHKQLTNRRYVV